MLCGTGSVDNLQDEKGRYFSCEEVCGRQLACKNHTCTLKCHPGPCPTCPLLPSLVTTCPCGKTPLRYRIHCSRVFLEFSVT